MRFCVPHFRDSCGEFVFEIPNSEVLLVRPRSASRDEGPSESITERWAIGRHVPVPVDAVEICSRTVYAATGYWCECAADLVGRSEAETNEIRPCCGKSDKRRKRARKTQQQMPAGRMQQQANANTICVMPRFHCPCCVPKLAVAFSHALPSVRALRTDDAFFCD